MARASILVFAPILTGVEEAGLSLVVSSVHNRRSLTGQRLDSLLARGSEGCISRPTSS